MYKSYLHNVVYADQCPPTLPLVPYSINSDLGTVRKAQVERVEVGIDPLTFVSRHDNLDRTVAWCVVHKERRYCLIGGYCPTDLAVQLKHI